MPLLPALLTVGASVLAALLTVGASVLAALATVGGGVEGASSLLALRCTVLTFVERRRTKTTAGTSAPFLAALADLAALTEVGAWAAPLMFLPEAGAGVATSAPLVEIFMDELPPPLK